jgi:hypothetical protein
MGLWILCLDMSTERQPTGTDTGEIARARQRLFAIGVLASIFALLVAASYTDVAAMVVTGTMAATVIVQAVMRLASSERLCVPGTDISL